MATVWYEVRGRGSGMKLEGYHTMDPGEGYGKMTTGCGVTISTAFVKTWPRRALLCKHCLRKEAAREKSDRT
jgi:hypothetical protein